MASKNKNNIQFILFLTMAYLCMSNLSKAEIDFSDRFYSEILKASFHEEQLTDNKETSKFYNDSYKKTISHEAEQAKQSFVDNIQIWESASSILSDRRKAAISILSHLELNQKKMLTLGTIISVFGTPNGLFFNAYSSDEYGTELSTERFAIHYKDKDISFSFSTTGFCRTVSVISSQVGKGLLRWPQKYSYSDSLPIVCISVKEKEIDSQLYKSIEELVNKKMSYWDWVAYMERWPMKHKTPFIDREVQIMLIDQVASNLVIAYLKITGKEQNEILYCDTWWLFDEDNWILKTDEQMTRYFTEERSQELPPHQNENLHEQ